MVTETPRSNLLRGHRFAVLLVVLIAALAIQSLGAEPGRLGMLADAFTTLLVVAIFFVVFERPRERVVMSAILAGILGTAWTHHLATARIYFELSLEIYGQDANTLFNMALCHHLMGNDAETQQLLRAVLQDDPTHKEALNLIAP